MYFETGVNISFRIRITFCFYVGHIKPQKLKTQNTIKPLNHKTKFRPQKISVINRVMLLIRFQNWAEPTICRQIRVLLKGFKYNAIIYRVLSAGLVCTRILYIGRWQMRKQSLRNTPSGERMQNSMMINKLIKHETYLIDYWNRQGNKEYNMSSFKLYTSASFL